MALAARPVLADESPAEKPIAAARAQIGVTLIYDSGYTRIDFPNGDIGRLYRVCADVIVRAYRDALALDPQELLHQDMKKNCATYPATWGHLAHRRPVAEILMHHQRQAGFLAGLHHLDAFGPGRRAGLLVFAGSTSQTAANSTSAPRSRHAWR